MLEGITQGRKLIENRYAYTGREIEDEVGLYYYRARYYDPELGRFISEDPIGFEGGYNLYNYVKNNPLLLKDPSGLIVVNSVGDIKSFNNPRLNALYDSLHNDPNVLVLIVPVGSGGSYGSTSGNKNSIIIEINMGANTNSNVLANTIMHELVHAQDIRSGNFDFGDTYRNNGSIAEGHAEDVANRNFSRDNMCRQ